MELVFCVKEDARAVLVLYKYCSYFCGFVEICFNLVCMLRRLSNYLSKKIHRRLRSQCNLMKRVITQKIKDYVKEKYGVNVHTSYIAQVKRMCGLDRDG